MTVYPNAKINIGLNVTERRPDGYHHIETVFYPIGLTDVLTVQPTTNGSETTFLQKGIKVYGKVEENLVMKAYRLLKAHYEVPHIDIVLEKNIPFGAGLGGGSSDASFTLKSLNDIFNLSLSNEKLEELASMLGADCAFFIQNRPMFASGIGNEFTEIDLSLKGYYLLLVKPDIYVSTPKAYGMITPKKPERSLKDLIKLPVAEWKNYIQNDFEQPVFQKFPEIGKIKQLLYDSGAEYVSMSGSGSSVYGIFSHKPDIFHAFSSYFVSSTLLN